MKLMTMCSFASLALLLSGCLSTRNSDELPLNFAHGSGSEYGNYAAKMDGEMRGPSGERCVIFNWDRPLTKDLAVRLRSASCDSKERPGWMVSSDISRTVIPLSESNLKNGVEQEAAP